VYAYFTTDGDALRIRVSVDEADKLDVVAGARVRVKLPGREVAEVLITAVSRQPPLVWVELAPMISTVSRAG